MTNIQGRAKRIQEILETQDILKGTEHEQVKKVGNDLLKTVKCWKDEGIDRVVADSSGFAYFLKSLAETHSTEDIKAVVEVVLNMQHQAGNWDRIDDDLCACLDAWRDAGIDSMFALKAMLNFTAIELGEYLPEEAAKKVILDFVKNRYGDV